MTEAILELRGISKTYPGVTALEDVSLRLRRGEIVGLIGENGAGKSTLMKVLGGVAAPSEGRIVIDGVEHGALTVSQATKAGIAFVHQELNLFENLDVAANVFIGREVLRRGPMRLVDRGALTRKTEPLLKRLGADFGPDAMVADLSIAQRQLVEIAKALSIEARVIIMDEPTSSLTLSEADRLLSLMADLRAAGVSIIYISHRLKEIKTCADRVICLRDGRIVGELAKKEIDHAVMIRLMIGRDLKALYVPPKTTPREDGLEVVDFTTAAFPQASITLKARYREILGIAGLVGSGRTAFAHALFGVDPVVAGRVVLDGEPIRIPKPAAAIEKGIFLVPEDRKRAGLVLDMSVTENVSLADLRSHSHMLLIDRASETRTAREQRASLRIKTPDCETLAVALSGGNQQKIVLAKWLSMRPKVIVFDEPTRGIDVGAKNEIYDLMRALADNDVAIIMISSDMEEVIGVSDRIAVMHEGHISGVLERNEFSEYNVLELAVGHAIDHSRGQAG